MVGCPPWKRPHSKRRWPTAPWTARCTVARHVCRMRGRRVRNEQDARGKLAQIFTHPLRSRCGIARLYLARDLRHAGARTGVVVRPQTS
jgi:hypothetical protein